MVKSWDGKVARFRKRTKEYLAVLEANVIKLDAALEELDRMRGLLNKEREENLKELRLYQEGRRV